jgi:hypothetical protein
MGPAGDALVVWTRDRSFRGAAELKAAARRAGGDWSTPESVSPPGEAVGEGTVGVDGSGHAVAAWIGAEEVLRTAARPSGSMFGAAQSLSTPGLPAQTPAIGIDAAGNAVTAWLAGDIVVASRPAGGDWRGSAVLAKYGRSATPPALAVGPGGQAVVTWAALVSGEWRVLAAVRSSAGAPFGPPVVLSTAGASATEPTPAIGPMGDVVVAWRSQPPNLTGWDRYSTPAIFQAVRLLPGGGWSAPSDVSTLEQPGPPVLVPPAGPPPLPAPAVGVDSSGAATVVWRRRLADNSFLLQAATQPDGGTWSAAQDLAPASAAELAVHPTGDALVVWAEAGTVRSAARPAGGVFGAVETVGTGRDLALASSADDAVAVWRASWPAIMAAARPRGGSWGPVQTISLPDPFQPPSSCAGIPPPPPPPRPTVIRLRVTPSRTAVITCAPTARRVQPRACRATRAPVVTFTLSVRTQVLLTVQRRGRKAALRAARLAGRQGVNRVRLPRWAGRGALAPGAYVVRVRAGGDAGAAATARLVVLPR